MCLCDTPCERICVYLFEEGGREVMANPAVRGEHHQLMAQREGNSLSHHFCFAQQQVLLAVFFANVTLGEGEDFFC